MKHTLLMITALMLVVGCSKPIDDETLIEEGGLKYHPETKELYSGDVFKNYLGGKTEYEGSYKNGKQDGKWTYWWENGQKGAEETYKNGEFDGKSTSWHENGQKMMEGNWKNGKPWDGKQILWHQNGQKQSELTIKDGEYDGKWTAWYENGQKELEGIFKDGEVIEASAWDEDGNMK